jgi:hypothetical protein
MAIEIKYIIETAEALGINFPKIYKIVLENEVESFRAAPTLTEIASNDPTIVAEYYEIVKEFVASKLNDLPSEGLPTREQMSSVALAANILDDLYQIAPKINLSE